jgi:23S rRNA G2445 N2-methylase RlmL
MIHCFRSSCYPPNIRVFIASTSCCHDRQQQVVHNIHSLLQKLFINTKKKRYYSTIYHHNSSKILQTQPPYPPSFPHNHKHAFTHTNTHRCIHSQSNHNKIKKQTFEIFASTLPGFESILSHELETKINISKDDQSITNGGISFDISSIKELYQCHLYLGTASHLLLRVPTSMNRGDGENVMNSHYKDKRKPNSKSRSPKSSLTTFYAVHTKQLIQKVRNMNIWKELIPIPMKSSSSSPKKVQMKLQVPKFDIRVTCTKSKLYHTKLIAQCVQKGIYKALDLNYNDYSTISDVEETTSSSNTSISNKSTSDAPKICILVRIDHDEVQISIDTSLSPLHRRGYKLDVGKAPLREDIAYAFLYSLGWSKHINNPSSNKLSKHCLIDPFCGSGTIVIEGANMALGLPPGRLRSAPCQFTNLCDKELWEEMIESSMKDFQNHLSSQDDIPNKLPLIIGSDRDEGAIQSTIANSKRAGVDKFIQFQACSIKTNPWLDYNNTSSSSYSPLQNYDKILVATNPPYGLRISPSSLKQKQNTVNGRKQNTIHPLLPLYQTLGNIVHGLKSYEKSNSNCDYETKVENVHLGIISHDIDLARRTGVPDLKKKFTTRLGGIHVTALGSC